MPQCIPRTSPIILVILCHHFGWFTPATSFIWKPFEWFQIKPYHLAKPMLNLDGVIDSMFNKPSSHKTQNQPIKHYNSSIKSH